MAAPVVGVVGMAALRRDINRLVDSQSSALYTQLKAAGRTAATPVADRARSSYPVDSGALAGDVRVSATRTGATVRVGRQSIPYAGWVDFGGTLPTGAEREYRPDGRVLFPAARSLANRVSDLYSAALDRVFSSDATWTNTSSDPEAIRD